MVTATAVVDEGGVLVADSHRSRSSFGVAFGFLVLGSALSIGARLVERDARACSCVEEGWVSGRLVEVRRVAGTGNASAQQWWSETLGISVRDESTAFAYVESPLTPDMDLELQLVRETQ